MGMATTSKPPLFHSKLLCISLLYLSAALFLALRTLLSTADGLFRRPLYAPIQTSFSYNSSYGEHKHALPTLRPSCVSPVFFSGYWDVVREIEWLCRDSSSALGAGNLRYVQGDGAGSFGGNFTAEKRFSYFDHSDDLKEIPCGFLKPFPVSNSDKTAMEGCNGVVVVSAMFNDHDKIRQPKGLGSSTLNTVCFFMFVDDVTINGLHNYNLISTKSKEIITVGVWRIVRVDKESLYENAAMNGVIPKYLTHRLFPNAKYSIWADAKMRLVVDPLLLVHSLVVKEGVDMAISKHPLYLHTMEEAMATARWKKWGAVDALRMQMETYCENGMQPWTSKKPYPSDVPDSAVIIRKHSKATNLFSCLLFNELEAFNPRDQLPFAYVRDSMNPKLRLNMFEVEVFEHVAVEYRHNLKHGGASGTHQVGPWAKMESSAGLSIIGSKCDGYLVQMWGKSK